MSQPAAISDGRADPVHRKAVKRVVVRSPDVRLLVMHQNFPGQFRGLASAWAARPDLQVLGLGRESAPGLPGVAWQRYRLHRQPTEVQHPTEFQHKIVVQHEGIDTRYFAPDPQARFKTPSGVELATGDPVITYVARNLEPYRGFHIFMRALARVQGSHPRCHAIIVGGDEVSYGTAPVAASNWREKLLREVSLDPLRTHFTGRLPRADYRRVLQVSAAHVSLTYPFVLSWSLVEALSTGCRVIGSRTESVEEVMRDGENGVLVDFFDAKGIALLVLEALESAETHKVGREKARMSVQRFDIAAAVSGYQSVVMPQYTTGNQHV